MGEDMGAQAGTWVRAGSWGQAGQRRTNCSDGFRPRSLSNRTKHRDWGGGQGAGRLATQAPWVFYIQVMDLPISLLLLKTPTPETHDGLVHRQ